MSPAQQEPAPPRDRRVLIALLLLAFVAAGLLNALPHLHESFWQDEASTLEFHASSGILHPLLHYGSPNNHIAFSAMLAAWLELVPTAEPAWLRMLPLAFFLLALPIVLWQLWAFFAPALDPRTQHGIVGFVLWRIFKH
jgi:Sec-independent protein secretion pathway component TatC